MKYKQHRCSSSDSSDVAGGEETMNGALGLPAPNASTSTIEAGTSMALPPSANPSSSPTLENQVTPESTGQSMHSMCNNTVGVCVTNT